MWRDSDMAPSTHRHPDGRYTSRRIGMRWRCRSLLQQWRHFSHISHGLVKNDTESKRVWKNFIQWGYISMQILSGPFSTAQDTIFPKHLPECLLLCIHLLTLLTRWAVNGEWRMWTWRLGGPVSTTWKHPNPWKYLDVWAWKLMLNVFWTAIGIVNCLLWTKLAGFSSLSHALPSDSSSCCHVALQTCNFRIVIRPAPLLHLQHGQCFLQSIVPRHQEVRGLRWVSRTIYQFLTLRAKGTPPLSISTIIFRQTMVALDTLIKGILATPQE